MQCISIFLPESKLTNALSLCMCLSAALCKWVNLHGQTIKNHIWNDCIVKKKTYFTHYPCEPPHDKTNKMSVRPAKTQIRLGIRPIWSESSLSAWRKSWVLSYRLSAQRRLWSDWADAQADLSLRWTHSHFVGFVMSRLLCWFRTSKSLLQCHFLQSITESNTGYPPFLIYPQNIRHITINVTCVLFSQSRYKVNLG